MNPKTPTKEEGCFLFDTCPLIKDMNRNWTDVMIKGMEQAKECGIRDGIELGKQQTLKDELEFLKSLMNCLSHIQVDKFLTERIAQIEKELGEEE